MIFNLEKGQRFNLTKEDGTSIEHACVGVNWGAIETKTLFGITRKKSVDLDATCIVYNEDKKNIDSIFYGCLRNNNNSIVHSGDDLNGDTNGNDGKDNEVITIDFKNLPSEANYLAIVLNSFNGVKFNEIPYSSIRIYDGTPDNVGEIYAKYDITTNTFDGKYGLIIGVFYKKDGGWRFKAIGEPTTDTRFTPMINVIKEQYL